MDQHLTLQNILFLTLYGGVTISSIIACCYLLFRRANAFVPDVKPPIRLRKWTAAFLATMAVSHVWWLLIYFVQPEGTASNRALICIGIDIMTIIPTILCTMLAMMQDRRRPLWPIAVVMLLSLADVLVIHITGVTISTVSLIISFTLFAYILIKMVYAVMQYGNWLRNNFADLEHKEVWHNFLVLGVFMLSTIFYNFSNGSVHWEIIIQLLDFVLIFILLWRVETLETLEEHSGETTDTPVVDTIFTKIDSLLQQHCVDTKFYLQQDVSVSQLARLVGTNRTYLSQYFAQQGMTYNSYINSLRIEYFIRLYREAIAEHRPFTTSQLAYESGFRSYTTFSTAFKQVKGQTASAWMNSQRIAENDTSEN